MRTFVAIACTLASAGGAAAAPLVRCMVAEDAIGLRPEQLAQVRERVHLAAEGANAVTLFFDAADRPEAACFDAPACVRDAVRDRDVDAAIHLQMVRVGGTVQITARSFRGDTGEQAGEATVDAEARDFPSGLRLRELLITVLRDLRPPEAQPEPAAPIEAESIQAAVPIESGSVPSAAVSPGPPPASSSSSLTSIIVIAAGSALMIAGTVMAGAQEPILTREATSGEDKERAHTIGRVGWGFIGGGGAVVTTGLVLLGLELFGD